MSRALLALPEITYMVASALFILGLRRLSSPATARSGNLLGAIGMLMAVLVTLVNQQIVGYSVILAGVVIGSALGAVAARTIKMTAMPQMVALLNGLGGGASALVAWGEYLRLIARPVDISVTIMASIVIGGLTLSGSLIAFAKLQDLISGRPVTYPWQNATNLVLLGLIVAVGVDLVLASSNPLLCAVLVVLALVLGVLMVLPIGGADMPVVIALLNACSGLAAASTGFVLRNNMLIIAGALVGASGVVLTSIMCKAMNRTLGNVVFGAFGKAPAKTDEAVSQAGKIARQVTVEDAAILLAYSKSVIVVPGYGMAVAQAQHAIRELADVLATKGVDVKYAIHPVAGRMPGHMNVLLAEANVPYDQLYEMDRINSEFARTDVALVIGANDVTNPAAHTTPSSPLYGMPILDVNKARNVIVIKRSLRPGFAGADNALFYDPKTRMLFKDAKEAVSSLIPAVKAS